MALARNAISATGLVDICTAANVPPPSMTGLQKMANAVNPQLERENMADMSEIRKGLKQRNELLGHTQDHPISVEADATYNNRFGTSAGKTPMQPATQATYLVAENVTKDKKIIAARTYSKLCQCDDMPETESHKDGCPANLKPDAVIGNEGQYFDYCIFDIQSDNVSIEYVTIDGDSSA